MRPPIACLRSRAWLVCLLALCAAGCRGDEAAPLVPFRRVELRAEAASPPAPRQLARVTHRDRAAIPFAWSGSSPAGSRVFGKVDADPEPVDAWILEGRQLKYVRGPIPEDARAFNHVIVEAAASADAAERIRLYLYRDGERVLSPKIKEMARADGVQVITFDLPELRGSAEPPDEFGVAFDGRVDFGAFVAASFVDAPTTAFAPPQSGEGELVRIGEDLRRALGLVPRRELVGELRIGADEELRFAVGIEPVLARPGETLDFQVDVAGSTATWSKAIAADPGAGWIDLRVPSGEIGEGAATMRVSVASSLGDDDAVGLVSVPTIRRLDPARSAPPTVLLITSDTHRADHLGILGPDAPVSTPHLDALARRGVLFTNCVAPTNVTSPSHIALMTGIHPRDTGVLTNFDRLAKSAHTLAEAFRDAGYETFAAASVQQLLDDKSGIGQGFDRMDGPATGQRPGPEAIEALGGWLDDAGAAPVFAWLHVYDAHAPYSPPAPYSRRYYPDRDPYAGEAPGLPEDVIPSWARRVKDLSYPYAQYRAEVDFVDGSLERILSIPRVQAGTVAFTADHGELFGEHGVWWSHSALYPGILRIPLILAGPSVPSGARTDAAVQLTDLGATLQDLAGVPRTLDGANLLERMDAEPAPEPRFALAAHHNAASIESGGWFLTLGLRQHRGPGLERERQLGEVELFDLSRDPGCERDLVLEELERAKRLRGALIAWLDAAAEHRLSESQQRTESDESMLAALGYGGGGQSESAVRYWNPDRFGGAAWQTSPWRRLFEDEGFSPDDFRRDTGR